MESMRTRCSGVSSSASNIEPRRERSPSRRGSPERASSGTWSVASRRSVAPPTMAPATNVATSTEPASMRDFVTALPIANLPRA